MISIELIRNDPDKVRDAMTRRGDDVPIDLILELDKRRRATIAEADQLRSRRKTVSREIGHAKDRPQELVEEMREVGSRVQSLEESIRNVDEEINSHLLKIPNLPQDDVPLGEDETDNVVVKTVGEIPNFDFEPLPRNCPCR